MSGSRLVILSLLAACGGAAKPAPVAPGNSVPNEPLAAGAPAPPAAAPAAPLRPAPTAEAVCKREQRLEQEKCGAFGVTIHMKPGECLAMFSQTVPDPREEKSREKVARCVVEPAACDGVSACLADLGKVDRGNLRTCEDVAAGGAVGVSQAEYDARNGSAAARFSEVKSTAQQPIERCGIDDANEWLGTLVCGDGSRPIKSHGNAEQFRLGNIGAAGRCHSIVDQYRILCPGGATDIYIDAYVCPR